MDTHGAPKFAVGDHVRIVAHNQRGRGIVRYRHKPLAAEKDSLTYAHMWAYSVEIFGDGTDVVRQSTFVFERGLVPVQPAPANGDEIRLRDCSRGSLASFSGRFGLVLSPIDVPPTYPRGDVPDQTAYVVRFSVNTGDCFQDLVVFPSEIAEVYRRPPVRRDAADFRRELAT